MPVGFSNSFAMDWPAATGVDVYQVTLPSRLAAASSTGSGLNSCLTSCADAALTQRLAIKAAQIRVMASSRGKCFSTIADVHRREQDRTPRRNVPPGVPY